MVWRDPHIYAKAAAAAEAVMQAARAEIDAIQNDLSLTPAQKAAAIAAARLRHRAAAAFARRRVLDDEKARVKAARRLRLARRPPDGPPF